MRQQCSESSKEEDCEHGGDNGDKREDDGGCICFHGRGRGRRSRSRGCGRRRSKVWRSGQHRQLPANFAAGILGSVQVQVNQRHRTHKSHWKVHISEILALAVGKGARGGDRRAAAAAKMDKGATVDTVSCSQVQMSNSHRARQSAWGSDGH